MLNYSFVSEFWNWFSSNCDDFSSLTKKDEFIARLNDSILHIDSDLDWEIGPWYHERNSSEAQNYLAISPCLDKENLNVTKAIVAVAPRLFEWIFLASKPQKPWSSSLKLINEVGKSININLEEWMYQLIEYDDKTLGIELLTGYIDANHETKELAADIVLSNILGEELFMEIFASVQVIESPTEKLTMTRLLHLRDHLCKLGYLELPNSILK